MKTNPHTHPHLKGPHQSPRLPRFSADPILALVAGHDDPCDRIAQRTGYSRRAVSRWISSGLSFYVADRVATRLGYHPATLWEDWYNDQPMTGRPLPDTDART